MKKYRPTTPSRRGMTAIDYSVLSPAKPVKGLLKRLTTHAGRNNQGRITTRHQSGGNKKLYRVVDFKQIDKLNIPAKVESVEYDPYRSAFIARVLYNDGERRYIIASKEMKVGTRIITAQSAPLDEGNRLQLKNIPIGYFVHNIEIQPEKGGQMAKSAGSYVQVLAQEGKYTHLKLPSTEIRKVLSDCYASLGQVSNVEYNLVNLGKAGRSRKLGIRPTVRGTAMNPVDHPYGGGEGRQPRGTRKPKSAWGKVTGGVKTRKKKKQSSKFIVKRRSKKKSK